MVTMVVAACKGNKGGHGVKCNSGNADIRQNEKVIGTINNLSQYIMILFVVKNPGWSCFFPNERFGKFVTHKRNSGEKLI